MYIVIDGALVVYKGIEESGRLEGPCIIGEEALLYEQLRSHSVASLTELRLAALPRKKFQELVRFISPQNVAQAKTLIESHKLFPMLD